MTTAGKQEFCLAINFEKLKKGDYQYKVSVSVPAKFVPDTAKPVYNKLVRLPDLSGFTTTLNGPSVAA